MSYKWVMGTILNTLTAMISEGTLCKNWHSGRMRGRWCYRSINEHWKVVIHGTSMAKEFLFPLFPLYVISPDAIPNHEASMLQIFPDSSFFYTPEREVSLYAVFQVFGNDINSLLRYVSLSSRKRVLMVFQCLHIEFILTLCPEPLYMHL